MIMACNVSFNTCSYSQGDLAESVILGVVCLQLGCVGCSDLVRDLYVLRLWEELDHIYILSDFDI